MYDIVECDRLLAVHCALFAIFAALGASILHIRDLNIATAKGKLLASIPEMRIAAGEIHGIIGESGSGKSLSLLSIMGLLSPGLKVSGSIHFNGNELLGLSAKALQGIRGAGIGMVFQEPMSALNPQMRCGSQLLECISVHHNISSTEKTARAKEAMRMAGLSDIERIFNAFPHEISGGQRQRVMIAMAIVNKPALVLADEPTTALDSITARQVLQSLVQACSAQGSALLMVSHDLKSIAAHCGFVHVMRQGQTLQQGTAEEVISKATHPYVLELKAALPKGWKQAEPASAPALQAKALSKTYGRGSKAMPALRSLDFSLSPGETLAVIGFSGSGKSTLAKILTGLERTGSGSLVFRGDPLLNKKVTGVQMVFQDPYSSLNNHISNLECVAEVLRVLRKKSSREANEIAEKLMLDVGLNPAQGKMYPHQLSGGQRQRLCIARALAADPEVLVLDESVAALDPLVQKQILELLKGIQQQRKLIYIFITHDLDVARSLADKFLVLEAGQTLAYGSQEEIRKAPGNLILDELLRS